MEFEWDEAKDAVNRARHGIGLNAAAELDWARAEFQIDDRQDYGEERIIAYLHLGERLHVCIYTLRNKIRRIISLRKANIREIRDHVTQTQNSPD